MPEALLETNLNGLPVKRGKVRDIYDCGDQLLIITTDRISAFDWVFPNGIPDKGRVLSCLTSFWTELFETADHTVCDDADAIEQIPSDADRGKLHGRTVLVHKCDVPPVECVVRGYIDGSGWKEYLESGAICGIELQSGLERCQQLEQPIFTPATKAEQGEHDENISFEQMVKVLESWLAERPEYKEWSVSRLASALRQRSIDLYRRGAAAARKKGIVIADTKFEWGLRDEEIILIDEVLTPDSSRFWPADQYEPGHGQPSFDKQFVRDWISETGWDKNSTPPALPSEIVAKTRAKYIEAYEKLTGQPFPWK